MDGLRQGLVRIGAQKKKKVRLEGGGRGWLDVDGYSHFIIQRWC
jgi:hypothetical protein